MKTQRLDKIISSQFNLTRSNARRAIRIGQVSVDGKIVKEFATAVDINSQKIEYCGKALSYKEHIYIIMNKPKGVLSASQDKLAKTVVDLIPQQLMRKNLFPVGRLDRDTTGLLIITDDGDFAHSLLSPKKKVYKTYIAVLDGDITDQMCKEFTKGIVLADGTECRPAYLKSLGNCCAEIKICEGRYHQIKRMFGVVGLGVNELKRVAIDDFWLPEDLKEGECRELEKNEISLLLKDC